MRTIAKIPYGSLASFSKTGKAKQAVFPLPVCAHPITLLPFKVCYKDSDWIVVGFRIPTSARFLTSHFDKPISLNVLLSTISV